jgi:hypothetical protein
MQTYYEFKRYLERCLLEIKENTTIIGTYEFFSLIAEKLSDSDNVEIFEKFPKDVEIWEVAYNVFGTMWLDKFGENYASNETSKHFCLQNPSNFTYFSNGPQMKGKAGKKFILEVLSDISNIEDCSSKYQQSFLDKFPSHMRRDHDIAILACKIHGSNYAHVSNANNANDNLEMIKAAIQTYPLAYLNIPDRFKNDKDLALAAVDGELEGIAKLKRENNVDTYHKLLRNCDWIRGDKAIALKAMSIDGNLLERYRSFVDDKDVVMEAVKQCGIALAHATNRLKADEDICRAAISNSGEAMRWVDDRFKSDIEFCLHAFKGNVEGRFLHLCDLNVRCDKSFVQLAIEANPHNYQGASNQLKMDKDIYEPLIKIDGPQFFKYLPYSLCNDIDVVIMALDKVQSLKDELEASKLNGTVQEYLENIDYVVPSDILRSEIFMNAGASILRIIDSKDRPESEYDTNSVRNLWNGGNEDKDRFDEAEKKIRLFKLSQSLQSDLEKEPPAIKPKRMKI